MQPDSRRWALRQRTAQPHKALDDLVGSFDSDQSYRRYLSGMAAFRLAVEPWLGDGRLPFQHPEYRPSLIADAIRADLEDVAIPAPPPVSFTQASSPDRTLGILYVLEGSALGAQLLVKRAAALGYTADHGARHLARQTASLDNWRAYLSVLDSAQPLDMELCVAAAVATFAAAQTAFEGVTYA